jgi:tRNA-splicing endonuclease subunit Sen2
MSSSASPSVEGTHGPQTVRRPRPQRPNYKHIHRFPLPVHVHPLPPLIPHNPLSVISVLLSYLTCLISPPHHEIYSAYFDSATSSVHVTDEKAIRALWEMGFFGKGILSRSEPSWLEREKKRRGLLGQNTSEETTGKRRIERREWKLERARKEREAIVQRLKEEAAAKEGVIPQPDTAANLMPENGMANGSADGPLDRDAEFPVGQVEVVEETQTEKTVTQDVAVHAVNGSVDKRSPNGTKTVRFSPIVEEKKFISDSEVTMPLAGPVTSPAEVTEETVINQEHLQLSNEEAFFLTYGLGVLQVFDGAGDPVQSAASLLKLFCQHSYFPPRAPTADVEPDDPFMVSYVVYHHFRSLGWVVRSGVKFGVDYLLYNRGPVFAHAEYAVIILPSYEHSYWAETQERRDRAVQKQARSWWWFHCVNRVQAQVKKTLVLCFVDIPPPPSSPAAISSQEEINTFLRHYKVREMTIRRWVPNRSRD